MSDSFYYLNAAGQPVGPMALGDIRKLRDAGIVESGILVCPAGEQEWKPLSDWAAAATASVGPPRVPPPPRSRPSASVASINTSIQVLPDWLAPVSMGAGILSLLTTFLPALAFLIAIPALVGGILILRRPASPKRGFAIAAVASGALGAAPALLFLVGVVLGINVPNGGTNSSVERKIVGTWVAGTGGQFGVETFGAAIRAEFAPDGNCMIKWSVGFGTSLPNDPRGAAVGMGASGRWEVAKNPERIIARTNRNPQFAISATGDEGSRSARFDVESTGETEEEVWVFEIRRQGDRIELFSIPPNWQRGYTFVREK